MTINSENTIVDRLVVQGYEVTILRTQEEKWPEGDLVIWTDHNYLYMIETVELSDQEIDQIISSMSPISAP